MDVLREGSGDSRYIDTRRIGVVKSVGRWGATPGN
jgi:hypothetical protein